MDGITSILNTEGRTPDEIVALLKDKSVIVPDWSLLLKEYEPTLHEIVHDHFLRKDKAKKDGIEPASRIYIGLEQLLTKRMTEFMFAIPVKRIYHNIGESEERQKIARAIELIYKHARIDTENIRRGTNYFASCEAFTIWYTVESKNSLYGFPSAYKLKCKTYSPMDGVRLYPLIDELDDMQAMSFEYHKRIGDDDVIFFETYTAETHHKWRQSGGSWETVIDGEPIAIHKIPGIYLYRPQPIYHGLSYLRKEIEYTLSRNSDVIAYNSAPILKVSGGIKGTEDKGETRRVFRVESGGDVSYVSWAQSIEALKYHVETLTRLFWSQAQMPDISFDNMMSLGNIGYDARQTLLADAHLKVGDESGPWITALEREYNIIKAFLKEMNTAWAEEIENIEVEHVITPFIQNDETAVAQRLNLVNGGKAMISQLESIQLAGYSSDAQATLRQINKENAEAAQAESEGNFNNLFGAMR